MMGITNPNDFPLTARRMKLPPREADELANAIYPHPDKPHTWMSGDDLKAHIRAEERMRPCFCTGPKNGQPLCPCKMRDVEVRGGRYVTIIDHGPVR